jgi:hypothetical protein
MMKKTGISFFRLLTKNELTKQQAQILAYDQKKLDDDTESLSSKLCLKLSLLSPKRRTLCKEDPVTLTHKK